MASFGALYILEAHDTSLLEPIGHWLSAHGFGPAERVATVPSSFESFHLAADAAVLDRLNDDWHMLELNGFKLSRRHLDTDVVRSLAERLGKRVVFFAGQTTSDAYQLVVFDGSVVLRSIMVGDGQCVDNEGARLPGERENAFSFDSSSDDEEEDDDPPSPMDDLKAICAALGFALWEGPLSGPVHVWKRRSVMSRLFGR